MLKNIVMAAAALSVLVFVGQTQASFSYTVPASTYNQSFDSLPNSPTNVNLGATPVGWTDDNAAPGAGNFSIVGWYLWHPTAQGAAGEGGFNQRQRMRIGAGTANTGAFMSFGDAGSTERALGSLSSNALTPTPPNAASEQYIGLRITNNTGGTLNSFTVSYDGEQWRDGGASPPNAQQLTFAWSQTAATVQDNPAFTNLVPTLNFVSPVFTNTGAGAAVNGNTVGKLAIGPATVTGLTWANGTDLWLRWTDANNTGNDHGLAIDNLAFSATAPPPVPEPASLAVWGCLIALGMAGAKFFRR